MKSSLRLQDNVRAGYELRASALGAEDPAAGAAAPLAAPPDQLAPQLLLQRVEVRRDGHLQALAGGRRALAAPLGHRPRDLSLGSSTSSSSASTSSPTSETPGGRLSFLVLDGLKEAVSQTSDYKPHISSVSSHRDVGAPGGEERRGGVDGGGDVEAGQEQAAAPRARRNHSPAKGRRGRLYTQPRPAPYHNAECHSHTCCSEDRGCSTGIYF